MLSRIKNKVDPLLDKANAFSFGLRLKHYDDWQPELDEALKSLPEAELLPHELFRALMVMADKAKKKIILVTEKGNPVAIAGLRDRWGYWEPVTQWIVPGVLFPIKAGYLDRVLPALGLRMHIAWWRWQQPPPQDDWVINSVSTPTRGMPLTEDFEAYWRQSSHYRKLRKAQNKCKDFEMKVDPPDGAELIIKEWEARWRPKEVAEMPDLKERILVARFLQERGLHHALLLFNGDEPIAGGTMLIHRKTAVAQCNFRNQEYDRNSPMTHLINLIFIWAKDVGYERIDIGGSFEYKDNWAPEDGQKWEFEVLPRNKLIKANIAHIIAHVKDKL